VIREMLGHCFATRGSGDRVNHSECLLSHECARSCRIIGGQAKGQTLVEQAHNDGHVQRAHGRQERAQLVLVRHCEGGEWQGRDAACTCSAPEPRNPLTGAQAAWCGQLLHQATLVRPRCRSSAHTPTRGATAATRRGSGGTPSTARDTAHA